MTASRSTGWDPVTPDDLKDLDIQQLVHHFYPEIEWRTPAAPPDTERQAEYQRRKARAQKRSEE